MPAEMFEFDQMYSVREAPWHLGSGTNVIMLDTAPETRQLRMELSGQNWLVEEQDVFQLEPGQFGFGDTYKVIPNWKLLTRNDNGVLLNVARDSYEVVQNVVGHELFEALSGEADLGDGTGGTVKNGAQCYLSARVNSSISIPGDDSPIFPYIVVTWSHDGSGAVKARRTTVRVVCWNTLSASEAEARRSGREFTFRHTSRILDRIAEAKRLLEGVQRDTDAFIELADELVHIEVDADMQEEFIRLFIPEPPTTTVISDRVLDNINEARGKVRGILAGPTIPELHKNTGYGLVSAGVEYLDHLRNFRDSGTYLGRTLLRDEPLKAKLVPIVRKLAEAAA